MPPEFLEVEIDSKVVRTERCSIKEGTRFFLRIPSMLWSGTRGVEYQFFWRHGGEEWSVPHDTKITPGHLPYRHKSKPISRMINYARSDQGFRLDDAKHLLRLLAEDFTCSVGWMPEGWMMSPNAYLWVDLRSMDKHIGRYVRDGDDPHPFLTRNK